MINMPRLQIRTTNAKMTIQKREPKLQISGQNATVRLDKKEHKFQVYTKDAKIKIDNYAAFKQLDNTKKVADMEAKVDGYSRRKGKKAVSEYVSDGDNMMKIETKNKKVLSNISKRNANRLAKAEIKLEFFPENDIKINVQKGKVSTKYQAGEIKTNVQKNLRIRTIPGEVKTSATYPKVEIKAIGNNINYKL